MVSINRPLCGTDSKQSCRSAHIRVTVNVLHFNSVIATRCVITCNTVLHFIHSLPFCYAGGPHVIWQPLRNIGSDGCEQGWRLGYEHEIPSQGLTGLASKKSLDHTVCEDNCIFNNTTQYYTDLSYTTTLRYITIYSNFSDISLLCWPSTLHCYYDFHSGTLRRPR
jgi:hypothetical protein